MARLIVRKGKKEGTEYPLDGHSVILGRSKKADIQVPSVKASRKHAEVYATGSTYHVRDLHSKNGTFLNRRAVDGTAVLRPGDKIRIGHNVLEFVDENAPPAPAPEPDANFATVVEDAPREEAPRELVDPGAPDYKLIGIGLAVVLALVMAVIFGYLAISNMQGGSPAESTAPMSGESTSPTQ